MDPLHTVGGKYTTYLVQSGTLVLILLAIFLFAQVLNTFKEYQYIGATSSHTITVSGEGEALAVPNTAVFSVTIREEAEDVAAAQDTAAEKANDIIAYLESSDIEERDIKTTSYNVFPRYEFPEVRCISGPCPRGERTLVGYEVTQTLRVKVRDTDAAGELLSGVGSRGASDISGLSFEIEDEEVLRAEARRNAIADAQEKARVLAADLGVDLVRVVNFNESSGGFFPQYGRALSVAVDEAGFGGSVAPDLPVGENEITSNVTIVYEIR